MSVWLAVGCLRAAPVLASEQDLVSGPPPGDTTPVEGHDDDVAQPPEKPLPVAAPTAYPAAETATGSMLPPIRVYGILKPTIVFAVDAHESFGFATLVAPTAAGHPLFAIEPLAPAWSFQLQQSRIGVRVGEEQLRGVLEVDFVHFEQSSPVQQAFPRLRLAQVEYSPAPGHRLIVGQGWDLWSPLVPHTFDLVAALFQAGNSAFMRNQAIWLSTFGAVELGAALGMQVANPTPTLNAIERGLVPTLALRAVVRPLEGVTVTVSALGGMPQFEANGEPYHRVAAGGAASAEFSRGPLNLRGEGYGGINLANLGTLTLSQGHALDDVSDVGGFVSAQYTIVEQHALTAAVGGAFVLNPEALQLGYVPATDNRGAERLAANGPGIERNIGIRGGYVFTPTKGLAFIVEPSLFLTRHRLAPAERERPERAAPGVQFGARYDF